MRAGIKKTQNTGRISELGVFEHPKYGGYETLNKNCIYLDLGDRVVVVLYDTREKGGIFSDNILNVRALISLYQTC